MSLLECVELGNNDAERTVIWLHGLGADGHDFVPIVEELSFNIESKIRFVFPHAPVRPITVNAGATMRAWYDILSMDFTEAESSDDIHASQLHIEQLITREEQRGIASRNIILAGFSQGGAIALHTALRYKHKLAGILALSTYLPLANTLAIEASEINASIAIFQAHGTQDPVIPIELAEYSRNFLQQSGYTPEYYTYSMEHGVHPDEILQIKRWITKTFGL